MKRSTIYRAPISSPSQLRSGLDGAGGAVPGDRDTAAEIGLVGHVAGQSGVIAEDGVFDDRLARLDRREEVPKVRLHVVKIVALKGVILTHRLFAHRRIMLLMPLFEVGFAHRIREAIGVIARRGIFSRLGIMSDAELRDFENSVRTLEAVRFGILAAEIEAKINRRTASRCIFV